MGHCAARFKLARKALHAAGNAFAKCWLVIAMYQIRYLLPVAEELNYSREPRKRDVSQPTLSRAIRSLEAELGGHPFRPMLPLLGKDDLVVVYKIDQSSSESASPKPPVRTPKPDKTHGAEI